MFSFTPSVKLLSRVEWRTLLSRVGDAVLTYLFASCTILLPLQNRCYLQVTGTPLSTQTSDRPVLPPFSSRRPTKHASSDVKTQTESAATSRKRSRAEIEDEVSALPSKRLRVNRDGVEAERSATTDAAIESVVPRRRRVRVRARRRRQALDDAVNVDAAPRLSAWRRRKLQRLTRRSATTGDQALPVAVRAPTAAAAAPVLAREQMRAALRALLASPLPRTQIFYSR
jgi:hypothetical protein